MYIYIYTRIYIYTYMYELDRVMSSGNLARDDITIHSLIVIRIIV